MDYVPLQCTCIFGICKSDTCLLNIICVTVIICVKVFYFNYRIYSIKYIRTVQAGLSFINNNCYISNHNESFNDKILMNKM